MSSTKPTLVLDNNLRFVASDCDSVQNYIQFLKSDLANTEDPRKRVSLLGEIGVYLRVINQFIEAESAILDALRIVQIENLGLKTEVQQKIRLAHVWQEQKKFDKSTALFSLLIQICRENSDASFYLDFSLQHAGKNYFDQGLYKLANDLFLEALELRINKGALADQIESSQLAIKRTQELLAQFDHKTLEAYSKNASEFSNHWLSQPEPTDMYDLLKKHFHPFGKTADMGCGNGRDANWLSVNGFEVIGYDASVSLLKVAEDLYPSISFKQAFLPFLHDVLEKHDNVLCETVIMHLPKKQIPEAVKNLMRILNAGGILYLSWRVTEQDDIRLEDGRLYSAYDPQFILNHFSKKNILHFEDKISNSSGKRVCRLVYRNDQ